MTANLLISTKAESLPSLIPGPQSLSEGLNPYETEIVSKLDIIIGTLRALEDQFLQTRQEVIKKSSLEGKESAKIFAVKGRVIMNKKRYFRSLEGNIELLTNNLISQLDKVFQEFKGLKNIAGFDEKTETDGKVGKDPTVNIISPPLSLEVQQSLENLYTSPCIKSVALPSIKRIESAKKTGIANSNKLPLRNLIKASSATNIELPKPESIPNPQIFKSKDSPTPQLNIMSLPSLPEVPEAEAEEAQQTVVRVRLGLLHEIKDDMRTINPKKARPIRGHGFRLSPPSSGHEKKDDQPQRRSVDSQPEPHTLG